MCVVNVGTVDVRRVRTLRLWLSCVPSAGLGLPAVPRDLGGSAPSPSLTRD